MKRTVLSGALVLAIVLAVLVGRASGASTATCTDAQLVPRIAELLVSQGAPGYTRLARGKDTIVRAYLTNPTTCTLSNKQSITPVSATLDVTNPAPQQQLPNYAPLAGKLTAATQIAPTSDPFFVVPAHYLAPTANEASFNITFTLRITYNRTGSASPITTNPATTPNSTMTSTVDKKTNALRVLVQPMGDPTSTSTQWRPEAETTLQNIMTNAARALPVPSGATPELRDGGTGGIRYVVSTTLLDVKSLGLMSNGGKFCSNGANWNASLVPSGPFAGHTLKADLLQRLADYNLLNTPPADMVLGVIDGAIAWKSTDGVSGGCDDGRAATPVAKATGQVGWVRVDIGTYPTPLQMELLHPFGSSDSQTSFHSLNVEADGAGPNKGYNVMQRKIVAIGTGALGVNDHSIMNYNTTSIPYTKDNTLLEPNDWMDTLCNLGGVDSATVPPFANCRLNAALGTSNGVAAGNSMFQISGIVSANNVRVTDAKANVPGDVEVGVGANSSPLHLRLGVTDFSCTPPATFDKDVGLALYTNNDADHWTGTELSQGFGAFVSMNSGWTYAELRLNGVTKFVGCAFDPAPDIESSGTVGPGTVLKSFTPHFGGFESEPVDLCCNGRAIAHDGTYLYVTVAVGSEGEDQRIYKVNKADGRIVSSEDADIRIGALAYHSGGGPDTSITNLFGGNYTGTGDIYDIEYDDDAEGNGITRTTMFPFDDTACGSLGRYIDGLEYLPAGYTQSAPDRLAISGDLCDTVFLKTLTGDPTGDPAQFGTDNNSGITTDGAGGLWLARLQTPGAVGNTRLTHVNLAGNVLGEIVVPSYQAEDIAYDDDTFAPACAVWMNEATEGSPTVQAVAVPCAGGGGGGQSVAVDTTNARYVSAFFTCGDPDEPEDEKHTVFNGATGEAGAVVAAFTGELFCERTGGTPTVLFSASNGFNFVTGQTDDDGALTVDAENQAPTVNIAAPLNGAVFRRGERIHHEGYAADPEQGPLTLEWSHDGTPIPAGAGQTSFDYQLPANAPLGSRVITFKATESPPGLSSSTSVTITVRPAVCPGTGNCP